MLLDATIIRGVLLPAAMKLLGDWNWYLPRWLEWLPRLNVEAELDGEQVPTAPAATASTSTVLGARQRASGAGHRFPASGAAGPVPG